MVGRLTLDQAIEVRILAPERDPGAAHPFSRYQGQAGPWPFESVEKPAYAPVRQRQSGSPQKAVVGGSNPPWGT